MSSAFSCPDWLESYLSNELWAQLPADVAICVNMLQIGDSRRFSLRGALRRYEAKGEDDSVAFLVKQLRSILNGWSNNFGDDQVNSEPIIEEPVDEDNADEILTKEQACAEFDGETDGRTPKFIILEQQQNESGNVDNSNSKTIVESNKNDKKDSDDDRVIKIQPLKQNIIAVTVTVGETTNTSEGQTSQPKESPHLDVLQQEYETKLNLQQQRLEEMALKAAEDLRAEEDKLRDFRRFHEQRMREAQIEHDSWKSRRRTKKKTQNKS